MANVERRKKQGHIAWYVRWRDPDGKQHTKSFRRKVLADRYRAYIERELTEQTYIDPGAAQITVIEWSSTWLKTQGHLKPTTYARYEGVLSKHVLPRWGRYPLGAVRHADLSAWVTTMTANGHGPSTVAYAYRVMSLMLDLAMRDGRLAKNPALGIKLPRKKLTEKRYLTHEQVMAFVREAEPQGDVILVLAYCGLRWGELAALRAARIDLERRRLHVAESVTEVKGALTWGTPKSHQRRAVPIPDFLVARLEDRITGKEPDDLVFTTPRGAVLRNLNFRRDVFDRAARAAGLAGLTPHELRHTAASPAVSAGANVKAVQRMLGHASAAMTLDVYSGLFEDDLDEVARRLDLDSRVYRVCTQAAQEGGEPDDTGS